MLFLLEPPKLAEPRNCLFMIVELCLLFNVLDEPDIIDFLLRRLFPKAFIAVAKVLDMIADES